MPRPRKDRTLPRLTVSLEERDYSEVCEIAQRNDVSAAWVIRRAVQQYLGHATDSTATSVEDQRTQGGN